MNFIEEQNNLFIYEGKAWLAHCISADFGMGAGLAVQFNERYNLKQHMIKNYVKNNWSGKGYCTPVKEFKVFNLVTKDKYFKKPTYKTVEQALYSMKNYAVVHSIDTIATCQLGCGLDGLDWNNVRQLIKQVFDNTDITIIVCKLEET